MSGVSLGAVGPEFKTVRVRLVIPGSPAEGAGIRPGDVLVSLNGRPAVELGLDEIRTMFRKPGVTYTLVLKRRESTLQLKLATRRLI
jgi:C-terminal processing protease CtpA/Prc